jgi:hypothetical protein
MHLKKTETETTKKRTEDPVLKILYFSYEKI